MKKSEEGSEEANILGREVKAHCMFIAGKMTGVPMKPSGVLITYLRLSFLALRRALLRLETSISSPNSLSIISSRRSPDSIFVEALQCYALLDTHPSYVCTK